MACLPYEEDRRLALAGSLRREARLKVSLATLFGSMRFFSFGATSVRGRDLFRTVLSPNLTEQFLLELNLRTGVCALRRRLTCPATRRNAA